MKVYMTEPPEPQQQAPEVATSKPEAIPQYVTREELEAMLMAQEHRTFSLVSNFFTTRQHPKNDARRRNSVTALVYHFLFGRGAVTVGLSLTSIGSLWLTCSTLSELQRQNGLVQEQLGESRRQEYDNRRAENLRIMLTTEPCESGRGRCPAFHPTLRREALEALTNQDPVFSLRSVDLIGMDLEQIDLTKVDLNGADLSFTRLRGAKIPWTAGARSGRPTFVGAVWNETTTWEANMEPQFIEHRGGRFGSAGYLATEGGRREFVILSAGSSAEDEGLTPEYQDKRLATELRTPTNTALNCLHDVIPVAASAFSIELKGQEGGVHLESAFFRDADGIELFVPQTPLDICKGVKLTQFSVATSYFVSGLLGPPEREPVPKM